MKYIEMIKLKEQLDIQIKQRIEDVVNILEETEDQLESQDLFSRLHGCLVAYEINDYAFPSNPRIVCHYEYIDGYDELMDTHNKIDFPVALLEASKEEIQDYAKTKCLERAKREAEKDIKKLEREALNLGYKIVKIEEDISKDIDFKCPHNDCGWCYYTGSEETNANNGSCYEPQNCPLKLKLIED